MLSPQLRKKVFNLWTMFWSSGMTNPLVAIEQITYLLFLKQLEALDAQRTFGDKPSLYGVRPNCKLPHPDNPAECIGHDFCRWSYITENPTHELLSQYVFPWLRELDAIFAEFSNGGNGEIASPVGQGIMADAYFQFPRDKAKTLEKAIKVIDELFPQMTLQGNDLMGDIFEYLLSEIQTSGKNGQFRTPRHIIRFMVELLNPQPGERLIDPASGTGGFLFSTIQHLLKRVTPPDKLRLEADGTPYRLKRGDAEMESYLSGEYFIGYDNDRTMVRIGWMNLILHGVENPRIVRLDSLGKFFTESDQYRLVLANPPFTGSVDEGDLHERFPRKSPNSDDPITTKSELLFIWLLLDLLETKGRGAVIVPEGVLFGSTKAHKKLRRQLLFEHNLQAVISLPPGVFQPYSGVKTSILVFQKTGETPEPGKPPHTDHVWFYEVQADGYTLDAKRNPQPDPNDLWDALAKYPLRIEKSQDYHQPDLYTERWRLVDEDTLEVFPDLTPHQGKVLGIHELFESFPNNPQVAKAYVVEMQTLQIEGLYRRYALAQLVTSLPFEEEKASSIVEHAARDVRRYFNEARRLLDTDFEQFGYAALKTCLEQAEAKLQTEMETLLVQAEEITHQDDEDTPIEAQTKEDWQAAVDVIVREFAKLDGFNVDLRTVDVRLREEPLDESRSWAAPVRTYARDDEWQDIGTHDERGKVRPEYIAVLKEQGAFEENGTLKAAHLDVLDPDCIEANDFNLSAGRYKPFVLEPQKYEAPAEILRAVRKLEMTLISSIDNLLTMIGTEND